MFGFLNVYKPSGITSHKIISIIRKIIGIKQIGHGGTLDPLACGVLPIAIGKATKLIDYLPQEKRYIVGLEFGKRSDTFDIDGNIEIVKSNPVTIEQIKSILENFKGEINQIPPVYSAVHYKGKRLYELARCGKIPVNIPSRVVYIKKIDVVEFTPQKQQLRLDIECSKGTYIRSIVNDLGDSLGTGAVMYELQRIKSGGMEIEKSLIINENTTRNEIENNLINPSILLNFSCYEITEEEYEKIMNGNRIKSLLNEQGMNVLLTHRGNLLALAEIEEGYIQPRKLLAI